MKVEVDAWLDNQTKKEGHSGHEKQGMAGRLNWLFQPRNVPPVVLVLMIIALGAIAARNLGFQVDNTPVVGPLAVKIVPYSKNSILTVTNGLGEQAFKMKFNHDWCDFALHTPGTRMWQVLDVNHDGLDDFLLANPEKMIPGIAIFLQGSDGSLRLKRTLDINEKIDYKGRLFKMGKIQFFDLTDINGDHIPELAVSAQNNVFYPALLIVMTLEGERLLTIEHPGWFRNMLIRKINGKTIIYVAGTNNFISKYSEPVVLRISMDWNRHGVRFSFFRPDRKIAATVPEGVVLTYARFGDFPEMPGASPWEQAVIRPKRWGITDRNLLVGAGFYDSRIGKILLPGSGPFQEIRLFELGQDLSLIGAEYNDVVTDALGFHPNEEPYCSILKPHYWNGHDWQDTVCSVPCEDTARNVE